MSFFWFKISYFSLEGNLLLGPTSPFFSSFSKGPFSCFLLLHLTVCFQIQTRLSSSWWVRATCETSSFPTSRDQKTFCTNNRRANLGVNEAQWSCRLEFCWNRQNRGLLCFQCICSGLYRSKTNKQTQDTGSIAFSLQPASFACNSTVMLMIWLFTFLV